ncbi:MAG TPA: hypothetical protein VHO25_17635 [Polyangiaceae bacterium]|nr:hypothetical protein [Polyangiaceae bacterium]
MKKMTREWLSWCAVAAALGCGGKQAEPQTPAAEAPTASSEPAPAAPESQLAEVPAPATWAEAKTHEQQAAFMKAHVVPKMGPIFQAFDGEEFKEFGCKTCHGDPFQDHPPEFLPQLTIQGGKVLEDAEHPGIAKFMGEKVVPEMAAILGKQPYDPKTHEGFGCKGCHTVEMK